MLKSILSSHTHRSRAKTWGASPIVPEAEGPGDSKSLMLLTASDHFNLRASGPDAAADSPPLWCPAPPPHPHTTGDTGRPQPGEYENTAGQTSRRVPSTTLPEELGAQKAPTRGRGWEQSSALTPEGAGRSQSGTQDQRRRGERWLRHRTEGEEGRGRAGRGRSGYLYWAAAPLWVKPK